MSGVTPDIHTHVTVARYILSHAQLFDVMVLVSLHLCLESEPWIRFVVHFPKVSVRIQHGVVTSDCTSVSVLVLALKISGVWILYRVLKLVVGWFLQNMNYIYCITYCTVTVI